MKFMKTYTFIVLTAITLFACNNQESSYTNEGNHSERVNSANSTEKHVLILDSPISMIDVTQQVFEVNPKKQQTITGNHGTKITFPKGCFAGETEVIKIELKEYYGVSDMLMGGLSTTSDGKCIETDGMVYIGATNSKGSMVIPNKPVSIEMPTAKRKNEIKIFLGDKKKNGLNWLLSNSKVKGGVFFWVQNPDDTVSMNKGKAIQEKSYLFETANLGWINCDRFMDFENTTDLIVSLPESQKGAVYCLAFYSFNSILPAIPNEKGQLVFKRIPVGEKVCLIGIGGKDEQLYFGVLDLTTDSKVASFPELEVSTKDEIRMVLEAKFGNSLAKRKAL